MEHLFFENQGTNTYLVYAVQPDDVIDTMSLGMLTNNKISGLAQTIFTQLDATKYIKYNITAHVSVRQFFSGPVNKKRIMGVFKGIVNAMLSAEDYMIESRSIMLDVDYMFADVSTCETVLVCLPIMEVENNQVDLGSFFKNIMFTTQFDSTENCDYVAKIINYLNSAPMFSLNEFKNILESIDSVPQTKSAAQVMAQPSVNNVAQRKEVEQPVNPTPVSNVISKAETTPIMQNPINTGTAMNAQKATTSSAQKMAVPNHPAQQSTTQPADSEEKMSWFYLIQHYNKENAAKYKAQKGTPKVPTTPDGASFTVPGAPVSKNNFAVPGQPAAPAPKNNFAVPGQPATSAPKNNFAVPGQPAPAPKNNFAVPGQPAPAPKNNFAVPGQPAAPAPKNNFAVPGQPAAPAPKNNFAVPGQPVPQPAPTGNFATPAQPTAPQQMAYQPPIQAQPMSFGETTVLGGGANVGETTVLGASSATVRENPHLIRTKNNEKINLNKPVFRIGKEKSYVDYFIGDNTAISRSHANFITRDGEYFVTDTNSTNHTYVNGSMIQSNVETKLTHGDKVRLANEDFEFKLY